MEIFVSTMVVMEGLVIITLAIPISRLFINGPIFSGKVFNLLNAHHEYTVLGSLISGTV